MMISKHNTFYISLPVFIKAVIEEEEPQLSQREVTMPNLTLEEVEEKVVAAKAWKALGEDGVPVMVWKQLWPAVGE